MEQLEKLKETISGEKEIIDPSTKKIHYIIRIVRLKNLAFFYSQMIKSGENNRILQKILKICSKKKEFGPRPIKYIVEGGKK